MSQAQGQLAPRPIHTTSPDVLGIGDDAIFAGFNGRVRGGHSPAADEEVLLETNAGQATVDNVVNYEFDAAKLLGFDIEASATGTKATALPSSSCVDDEFSHDVGALDLAAT